MPESLSGIRVGKYEIGAQIGEGGMAVVYLAHDTHLDREVALKFIRTDLFGSSVLERMRQRFEREAKALARLSHPNIIRIIDYGAYQELPYFVLEYQNRGTLKDRMGRPISWKEAIALLLPVAKALDYAHQRGIIHRDIKPTNILFGDAGEPMLSDFGIAKLIEQENGLSLTTVGFAIGTPEYMSPEQGLGYPVDVRSDIYSLGIVLFELITGFKPFQADTPMSVILKHTTDALPSLKGLIQDLPDNVEKLIATATAKNPGDRFASMRELAAAMQMALNPNAGPEMNPPGVDLNTVSFPVPSETRKITAPDTVTTRSSPMASVPWWKRHRLPLAAGFLILLAAIATAMKLPWPWLGQEQTATASASATSSVTPTPLPPLPTIQANHVFIAQIESVILSTIGGEGAGSQIRLAGDVLDFQPGQSFETSAGEQGFAQLGFPGQVEVYMAPASRLSLTRSSRINSLVQLQNGYLLVRTPHQPETQLHFSVSVAPGIKAWLAGSMMGLWFNEATQEFYLDCLEDVCWIEMDGQNYQLAAGEFFHFDAGIPVRAGGRRAELWQFVPGLVAPPTPQASLTPTATSRVLWPVNAATRTATAGSSQGSSTATSLPSATMTPSPLPTNTPTPLIPTATRTATPLPTQTRTPTPPPTATRTPTVVPTFAKLNPSVSIDHKNPTNRGETFTITVTISGAGSTPTGTITIRSFFGAATDTECVDVPLVNGVASCPVRDDSVGVYIHEALYSGDWQYNSASASVEHTVQ